MYQKHQGELLGTVYTSGESKQQPTNQLATVLPYYNTAAYSHITLVCPTQTANQEIVTYSTQEAMSLVLNDSVTEVMGLIVVGALAFFLSNPINTFSARSYMVSTMMIPLQISAFFQNKTMGCTEVLGNDDSIEALQRQFPISVVFHMIVSGCCWFMEYQLSSRRNDVKAVMTMRKTLANAERQASKDDKKGGKKKK